MLLTRAPQCCRHTLSGVVPACTHHVGSLTSARGALLTNQETSKSYQSSPFLPAVFPSTGKCSRLFRSQLYKEESRVQVMKEIILRDLVTSRERKQVEQKWFPGPCGQLCRRHASARSQGLWGSLGSTRCAGNLLRPQQASHEQVPCHLFWLKRGPATDFLRAGLRSSRTACGHGSSWRDLEECE